MENNDIGGFERDRDDGGSPYTAGLMCDIH